MVDRHSTLLSVLCLDCLIVVTFFSAQSSVVCPTFSNRLPGRRNLLLCPILRRVSDLLEPSQESLVEPGQESLVQPDQESLVEPGQESLLTLFHSVGMTTSTPSPTRAFFMSEMAVTTETRKISSRDRRCAKCGTTEKKTGQVICLTKTARIHFFFL